MKIDIYITNIFEGGINAQGKGDAILEYIAKNKEPVTLELQYAYMNTSKSRLDILSVNKALGRVKAGTEAVIHIDSDYITNAIENGWLDKWAQNDFKNTKGKDVKNKELWKVLFEEKKKLHISAIKEGHTAYTKVQMMQLNKTVDYEEDKEKE